MAKRFFAESAFHRITSLTIKYPNFTPSSIPSVWLKDLDFQQTFYSRSTFFSKSYSGVEKLVTFCFTFLCFYKLQHKAKLYIRFCHRCSADIFSLSSRNKYTLKHKNHHAEVEIRGTPFHPCSEFGLSSEIVPPSQIISFSLVIYLQMLSVRELVWFELFLYQTEWHTLISIRTIGCVNVIVLPIVFCVDKLVEFKVLFSNL